MAWNPSPEVAVVRDASDRMGKIVGARLDKAVLVFTTTDGRMGFTSYGINKAACAEASAIGEACYAQAEEML